MPGNLADIDFQMIEVSVRLTAVHGESHFVTAWINVYPVGGLSRRPAEPGPLRLDCGHAPVPRNVHSGAGGPPDIMVHKSRRFIML